MTMYKSSTRKVNASPPTKGGNVSRRYSAGFIGGGTTSAGNELINSISQLPPIIEDQAPTIDTTTEEIKRVGLFQLFRYSTHNERVLMIVGIVMAAVAGLSMPVWLLLLAQSLETFNQIGTIIAQGGSYTILLDEMYKLIYSFAIVGAISLVSGTTYVALWTYIGEAQTLRIRKKFVTSALRQEMAWFDTSVGNPQELPVMAANAMGRIQMALGRSIADTFANLLSAVGCLMVAFGLDAPLALFMLCILPVIGIAIGIISCFMRKNSGLALEEFASAGAFASEVLTGIKTVASLRAEMWAVNRYTTHVEEAQKYSVRSQAYSKLASGIMGLLFYSTYVFAFIFGTYQAAERADIEASMLTPFGCWFTKINECGIHGSEVMVCIYGVILTAQFFALMNPGINAINLGRIAAAEIYSAIERAPTIDGTDDIRGVKLGDYDGSIDLRNIIFAYPSRPQDIIFSNFNLKIESGTSVALVGPSGSGKSSLSKLLLRLYDPIGGHIVAGGVYLTEINLKWWREQIGYVSQEPSLFPGTIRDNIAVGAVSGDITDEEVEAAAKAASAHDFIMDLPDGYDTFYSGSSVQLSGGQTQRISIARALVRNPKILLLDEATSALDTASERMVQDALAKIRQERKLTTVTVAHRLTTILDSDKIVVIADGSIQECGTHKELFEEGGIYTTLCEGQGLTVDAATKIAKEVIPAIEATAKTFPLDSDGMKIVASVPRGKDENDEEKAIYESQEVEEEETTDIPPDITGVSSRLWQYSKGDILYSVTGYAGSIIVGALPAGEAILFGMITGNFFIIGDHMRETNTSLSLWFFLLAGLSFIGNICIGIGLGVSGSRLTRRMRVLVFDSLMRNPIAFFDYPEHSTGELTTSLEEDSETVANVTGISMGQRIQVFSCLAAGLIVALVYSWQVGLVAVACVPLIIGSSIIQAKYASREPSTDSLISPATLLERSFADIIVLQAYGQQGNVATQYSASLAPDVKWKKKQAGYQGLAYGLSQFAVFGTFSIIFYVGIKLMISSKLGFTDFFVALLSIMFSSFGAGQSGADFSAKKQGLEAASRLFKLSDGMADKDDDDPLSERGSKPTINGKVVFTDCEFGYPTRPNTKIYNSFSLDIESHQSIAFTGRSGCGKSTALQLLLRFYRVSKGSIEVDNENVTDMNIGWLRDSIGYVGQMPVLFAGSIKDNIKLGKPDATEEEIITAAQAANAHNFTMSLSSAYDTDIGVGGMLLSGGQRQRVAIARAIIKNPKLLVLDEATAALDNESEKIVQAALDDLQAKNPRTTLTVAHRLETVKNCDKIVVLGKGCVQEEGTHSELLELKGVYHSLWKKQSGV